MFAFHVLKLFCENIQLFVCFTAIDEDADDYEDNDGGDV
jgi:hypothetical protein